MHDRRRVPPPMWHLRTIAIAIGFVRLGIALGVERLAQGSPWALAGDAWVVRAAAKDVTYLVLVLAAPWFDAARCAVSPRRVHPRSAAASTSTRPMADVETYPPRGRWALRVLLAVEVVMFASSLRSLLVYAFGGDRVQAMWCVGGMAITGWMMRRELSGLDARGSAPRSEGR